MENTVWDFLLQNMYYNPYQSHVGVYVGAGLSTHCDAGTTAC